MSIRKIDESIIDVARPSRYIGYEVNTVSRETPRIRFALAFPDTYEVGMSHLGLQILYAALAALPGVAPERCFSPWPDREAQLRAQGHPLTSLENGTPLSDFDLVGFSLQYELSYTNVLTMLDLGGIPLRAATRQDGCPIIVAGGPCAFNPEPLAHFIDVFAIGEGEELIVDITRVADEAKQAGLTRQATLERLACIEGLYVPSVHPPGHIVRKRTLANLNAWPHPTRPVVPLMQTVHDRIVLEIARGCTRGCRFCQAGMIWRPYRERHAADVFSLAGETLSQTGHDEISLLSLSAGEYSCLEPLLAGLMEAHSAKRVALGLPSLRVESLTPGMIEQIRRTRKTSFTLAPEAGTDRMRRIINKGNTADDLLATVDRVFDAGWKSVKLYFMIGLPGEEQSDLEGIIDLGHRALRAARGRGQVTVSLSTFVPKPHTPFQWEKQITPEETRTRQDFVRDRMRHRKLQIKWHDPKMSFLEGLFARGDRRAGDLLEAAWKKGCRFDGWSELLRYDLWEEAISESGMDTGEWLRKRTTDEALPWDFIDCGVSRDYLIQERNQAQNEQVTPDCRYDDCMQCGVCDATVANVFSDDRPFAPASDKNGTVEPATEKIYRMTFSKTGPARFLSHLEIASALTRALRRSDLAIVYSAGFHPHPKMSFATATSVGMESQEELMDVTALTYPGDTIALQDQINSALPGGLRVEDIARLTFTSRDLSAALHAFTYEIHLPVSAPVEQLKRWQQAVDDFMEKDTFSISRPAKGKTVTRDIRPFVEALTFNREDAKVEVTLKHAQQGSARPIDLVTHVLGIDADSAHRIRIIKTRSHLRQ